MILVFLRDGNCVEVEAAVGAAQRNQYFICFDDQGREVANFLLADVEAYTQNDRMAQVLSDDVCEEVTLIPADS
jgi:hypothetical protein